MASLAAPLAGGLASGFASSLFSKKPKAPPTILPSFNAGGLRSTVGGTTERPVFGITSDDERTGLISSLREALTGRAGEIRDIASQVRPGFGRLTEAAMSAFESARQRFEGKRTQAIGNLRDNLARRRVLGSSFATSTLGNVEAEFAQAEKEFAAKEQEIKATSFLQELDLTHKLMGEAAAFDIESFNVALNELNLQANLAVQLATGTASTMQSSANLQAQLMNQHAQQISSNFGFSMDPFIQQLEKTVSDKVASIFNPGG